MKNQYWIRTATGKVGPLTLQQVFAKLGDGSVSLDTPCCPTGSSQWRPISSILNDVDIQDNLAGRQPPPDAPRASARGTRGRRFFLILTVLAVASLAIVMVIALPSGRFSSSSGRGLGDTILRYKDCDYTAARWVKWRESASFAELAEAGSFSVRLGAITGWDSDNLWVATDGGRVAQLDQGHWRSRGKIPGASLPRMRPLTRTTLLIAGVNDGPGEFSRLDSDGVTTYGQYGHYANDQCTISHVHHGILELHGDRQGVIRFADGHREERPENRFPDQVVFRADNTPLKEYPLRRLRFVRHYAEGDAWAVAAPQTDSGFNGMDYKIVRRIGDRWIEKDTFQSDYLKLKSVWFGGTADSPFLIAVGEDGWVLNKTLNQNPAVQSVAPAHELTSRELIAVWGVSAAKYWVLDDNGSVWQKDDSVSRLIVRGLQRDNVKFIDAWVSPEGVVHAITEKELYRLETQ